MFGCRFLLILCDFYARFWRKDEPEAKIGNVLVFATTGTRYSGEMMHISNVVYRITRFPILE